MTLGSPQAVMAAVDQNLGVGFVTKRAVENHDRVVALRIEGLSLERDLNLIYESARIRGRHTRRSSTPSKANLPSISFHCIHRFMGERYRYAIGLLQH